MKTEQLEQLIKIVELGSMNEAAKALYISRSSLSSAMKKLEEELGGDIFVRHSRGIRLTDFGATVHAHAVEIRDRIGFLLDAAHGRGERQQLRVASTFCPMAADAFAQLLWKMPDSRLQATYTEGDLNSVLRQVASGVCRIGVVTELRRNADMLRHRLEELDLCYSPLCERALGAVVGERSPLYGRTEGVEPQELAAYPLLEIPGMPTGLARDGRSICVSELSTALRLAAESDAVFIGPDDMPRYRSRCGGSFRFIPVNGLSECTVGWIALRGVTPGPLEREYLEFLKQNSVLLPEEKGSVGLDVE